jgi:protein-tyrosine kinase
MKETAMSLVERAASRWQQEALSRDLLLRSPTPGNKVGLTASKQRAEKSSRVSVAAENRRPVARPPAKRLLEFDGLQMKQARFADWTTGRTRLTEELRIIKRQLLSRAFSETEGGASAGVIMVTSALPEEGKTFTSLNLALSIAKEPNHHVLLVDADGSRHGIRRFLIASDVPGLLDAPGLLDVVADPSLDVSDAIFRTEFDRLSVILAGSEQQHGPELLAGQRMQSLIKEMADRYYDRVILLDAPPCLVSSDPATLAAIVDQVVLVIEADRTQRGEVEASLELLRACPRISLILNKTKVATNDSFGSYSYNHSRQ